MKSRASFSELFYVMYPRHTKKLFIIPEHDCVTNRNPPRIGKVGLPYVTLSKNVAITLAKAAMGLRLLGYAKPAGVSHRSSFGIAASLVLSLPCVGIRRK
jgi:hypothetical protein